MVAARRRRRIVVVPHDPAWAETFRLEAEALTSLLGDQIVAIHHIGSTAIPDIVAKPVVDMLLEVRDIEGLDDHDAKMIARGYEPRGENGIPGRRYYVKDPYGQRSHHVHAFQEGDAQIERHLAFRDYLIAHPEDARAYGRLKHDLAAKYLYDSRGYTSGKDAFVREIDRRAKVWRLSKRPQDSGQER